VGDHEQRRAGGQLVLQVADVRARIDVDRVPAEEHMKLSCRSAVRSISHEDANAHRATPLLGQRDCQTSLFRSMSPGRWPQAWASDSAISCAGSLVAATHI
jgi:hypothetical protein